MFRPKYTISPKLLQSIKSIYIKINDLNRSSLPSLVLMDFVQKANSLSAYASTSIEGNPLPLTEVKQLLKHHPKNLRDSEREVLNYNEALKNINEKIQNKSLKFNLSFILKTQHQIMDGLIQKFRCGKLRNEPVFVNDPKTGKTIYWPPDHQDVRPLLNDLIDFTQDQKDKLDPLIVAGLFHKQFVIIHPFIDGNGRATRLLTKSLLAEMGLDTFNLFSFENYYNQNVSRYFDKVGVKGNYYELVNKINFTLWLEYFLDGILDELLRVQKEIQATTITPDTTLKPYHHIIINHIKDHGFMTDADYAKLVDRAKATRNLDFNKLIDLKLIQRYGKGKSTYYKLV